jgi:hypothetical protein
MRGGSLRGHRPSFSSSRATIVSVDLEAVERFLRRGETCEECEAMLAVWACLECDEIFCANCCELCHIAEPQCRHERLPYPIDAAAVQAHEAAAALRSGAAGPAGGVDLRRMVLSPSASVGVGAGVGLGMGLDTCVGSGRTPVGPDSSRTGLLSPVASVAVSSPHSLGGEHIRSPISNLEPSPTAAETGYVQGSRTFVELVYGESVGIQVEEVRGRGIVVKGFDSSWNLDAHPHVEIGDVVIGAAHHDLRGLSLGDAMGVLHSCGVPRAIRFRKDPPEMVARSKVDPDKSVAVTATLFTVTFTTHTLGMLVEWTPAGLVVRGFEPECGREVLASVAPGDYLVSVNAVLLDGLSKTRALDVLLRASVPRLIQFRRLVRHLVFAPWALGGAAELGAPPDFKGHLSPDAVGFVAGDRGFQLLPHGVVPADQKPGGDSAVSAALPAEALHALSPTVSITSHTALVGGGSGNSQYMGLGPRGAVGVVQSRLRAGRGPGAQLGSPLGGVTGAMDGLPPRAEDLAPPLTPSSSFKLHSTRFPYLVPVPTVNDQLLPGAASGLSDSTVGVPAGGFGASLGLGAGASSGLGAGVVAGSGHSGSGTGTGTGTGTGEGPGVHAGTSSSACADTGLKPPEHVLSVALLPKAVLLGSPARVLPPAVRGPITYGRSRREPVVGDSSGDSEYDSDGSGPLSAREVAGMGSVLSLSQLARLRRRFQNPARSGQPGAEDPWRSAPALSDVDVAATGPSGLPGVISRVSKWWMPLVETLLTRRPDKKSAPRFQANDKVMFFTRERAAGPKYILGRIQCQKEYMKARRGKQSAYVYQVAWTDYTLTRGVPDSTLSPRSFEELRQVSQAIPSSDVFVAAISYR